MVTNSIPPLHFRMCNSWKSRKKEEAKGKKKRIFLSPEITSATVHYFAPHWSCQHHKWRKSKRKKDTKQWQLQNSIMVMRTTWIQGSTFEVRGSRCVCSQSNSRSVCSSYFCARRKNQLIHHTRIPRILLFSTTLFNFTLLPLPPFLPPPLLLLRHHQLHHHLYFLKKKFPFSSASVSIFIFILFFNDRFTWDNKCSIKILFLLLFQLFSSLCTLDEIVVCYCNLMTTNRK